MRSLVGQNQDDRLQSFNSLMIEASFNQSIFQADLNPDINQSFSLTTLSFLLDPCDLDQDHKVL